MRKFLCDSERVVTLEEIWKDWVENNAENNEGVIFEHYLENCMTRNNGVLDEILTAFTPAENRRGAVMLSAVFDEDGDMETAWVGYLSAPEISREKMRGNIVVPYVGEWN